MQASARVSLKRALLFASLFLVQFANAQVTSTLQGRVTDPSGAVISGALVQVTNEETSVTRSGQTSEDGYFRIPDLLPGRYQLRVQQSGFKTSVQKGIEVTSTAVVDVDVPMAVGETTQAVEVSAAAPQIETTESRISEVVSSHQIQALPQIGRGLMWLTSTVPGVQAKAEDGRAGLCCDVMSSLASPSLSSGGSELKAAFYVDGVVLHYGDGMNWNLAFTPNPDAVEEMRVSTNPTSAEDGVLSGVQVQTVTKGGTNQFHGTAHYTFLEDSFNALPYGASSSDVGSWHQRFVGGTIGGPIVKDRLFFFAAYEGLKEKRAAPGGGVALVETEAFANWVKQTRPNSVAAQYLTANPPFRYADKNLVDVNGDGIPDYGTVTLDRPTNRDGNQVNGRIDYQTKSGRDRFYGTFWRNQPTQEALDVRPTFDYSQKTGSNLWSFVNAHTFSPASLNEIRFSTWDLNWDYRQVKERYNYPCIATDDGLGMGPCDYSLEVFHSRTYDVRDVFSWNRGRQSWKFGGSYRQVYMTDPTYLYGDIPAYNFASIIDFADDKAYLETRNVDASTGQLRNPFVEAKNQQLGLFAQNAWQLKPGLTINLGLRWDYYFAHPLSGMQEPRETYGALFTSDQVTPQGLPSIRNKKLTEGFDADKKNFAPRISVAWQPRHNGKDVIRGGFFILYDEINSLGLYRDYYGNPPISTLVNAGPDYGIPIVYGIAPDGTRNYPINPGMKGPGIDPDLGIFTGTRPNITGYQRNWSQPRVYDANAAYQRQLTGDVAVTLAYHYRHTPNDLYVVNANRVAGDLADGNLDRINPYYGSMNLGLNIGRRNYHGFVAEVSKRFSRGWQVNGSYNYHNSKSYGSGGGATDAFHPEIDYARDEPATHGLKVNGVWDMPFFAHSGGAVKSILGGWQLSGIFNAETGPYFNPASRAAYGSGGDFNADGNRNDRPDKPASNISTSYDKQAWMNGAIAASAFPLPTEIRNGTLPRNYFHGPGYNRLDASLSKRFAITERMAAQFQAQSSNVLNQVNISGVTNSLTSGNFARASSFYPMRSLQLAFRFLF